MSGFKPRAAVKSRRATNLASHLHIKLAAHLPNLATHLPLFIFIYKPTVLCTVYYIAVQYL